MRKRPGITPNTSIRIDPDTLHLARVEAVKARKTMGHWLEDAILEKIAREKEDANVAQENR